MANTTLTRPVVTMNLANRSIGRFGLLANRVMHPLAASRFGREVGMLTQMSDVKVIPSQTGITAQTEFGETIIDIPLYAKLLGKAGISTIELPKGVASDKIGYLFQTATTKRDAVASSLFTNVGADLLIIPKHIDDVSSSLNLGRTIRNICMSTPYYSLLSLNFLLPALLNIGMVAGSLYYFGGEQYKHGAHFGSYFNSANPLFIFFNIPQSRWIGAKMLLSSILMANRFQNYFSGWHFPFKSEEAYLKHIARFSLVNCIADIPILKATNDWTPDELKWQLVAIFLVSNLLSISLGYLFATISSSLANKARLDGHK